MRVTDLEQRVPVVFLVVMHESDTCLVILFALLVPELADVTTCLACFAAVPRLDDLCAYTKRAKSALARHERRVLLVRKQPAHDRAARIRVLGLLLLSPREGLRIVTPHAAMADAVARGQHELEVRVTECDLVVFWKAVRVRVGRFGRGWLVDHLIDCAILAIVVG